MSPYPLLRISQACWQASRGEADTTTAVCSPGPRSTKWPAATAITTSSERNVFPRLHQLKVHTKSEDSHSSLFTHLSPHCEQTKSYCPCTSARCLSRFQSELKRSGQVPQWLDISWTAFTWRRSPRSWRKVRPQPGWGGQERAVSGRG